MKKTKWYRPDSEDGQRSLVQHGYQHKERINYFGEKYNGNISLCGKSALANDDEHYLSFDEIEPESLNKEKVCKNCIKIFTNN